MSGPNVTAGQFYDVVVKDLRDHPGMRDLRHHSSPGRLSGRRFPARTDALRNISPTAQIPINRSSCAKTRRLVLPQTPRVSRTA